MQTFSVLADFTVCYKGRILKIEKGQVIAVTNWSQPGSKKCFSVVGISSMQNLTASRAEIEAATTHSS